MTEWPVGRDGDGSGSRVDILSTYLGTSLIHSGWEIEDDSVVKRLMDDDEDMEGGFREVGAAHLNGSPEEASRTNI